MTSKTYTIDLVKEAKRQISRDTLQSQISYVLERIVGGGREKKGWCARNDGIHTQYQINGDLTFCTQLEIRCNPIVPRTTYDNEFANIVEIVRGALKNGWEILKVNGEDPVQRIITADDFLNSVYISVDVPDNWRDSFSHLYERDAQIEIIHDVIEIAIESEWRHRFHVLLFGPPGCAKSDICLSVKNMLGSESVLEFDATATTSAGAIGELNSRDEMPRVLLIEEIEKADENSLRWLLGMLDIRGNIRKLVHRNKVQKEVKMLCIATVNDVDAFKRMMSGALASRFAHQLYCPRPDRALLSKILAREIAEIDGNHQWIDPTLDFLDKHSITDPRKAIAVCLTGRDRLIDGSFQIQMEKTMEDVLV